MSIADKLKGFVFEPELPADPTVKTNADGATNFSSNQPQPTQIVYTGVGLEMRKHLAAKRSTASGWDSVLKLKAACANLAEFVPDKKQQLRAALKTQGFDLNSIIQVYVGALNVLENERARFQAQVDDERARSRPMQQKNMADLEESLQVLRQKLSDITDQIASGKKTIQQYEQRLASSEAAFTSALSEVVLETKTELEQLQSLK